MINKPYSKNDNMNQNNTAKKKYLNRRTFLKTAACLTAGAAVPSGASAVAKSDQNMLQVWSCGGLAEAFLPANRDYEEKTGVKITYTGAFAAALGKSLMGNATTEVFAGRVLNLAKNLRAAGKMRYFKPLCFSKYVMVTPKGNPAGISSIQDLAKPGIKVILAPQASPPGGKAVFGLLKKAGVLDQALLNTVVKGSCVQRTMDDLVNAKGDVSVVEYRLTRMPRFKGKAEIIPIASKYFPPAPLTFTIGVMKDAADRALADHYINYILSADGQQFFRSAGFIPAISDDGRRLIEALKVKDV